MIRVFSSNVTLSIFRLSFWVSNTQHYSKNFQVQNFFFSVLLSTLKTDLLCPYPFQSVYGKQVAEKLHIRILYALFNTEICSWNKLFPAKSDLVTIFRDLLLNPLKFHMIQEIMIEMTYISEGLCFTFFLLNRKQRDQNNIIIRYGKWDASERSKLYFQ